MPGSQPGVLGLFTTPAKCLNIIIFLYGRKAAAEAVGALVHGDHARYDLLPAHPLAVFGDDSRDCAAGRVAELAFH